MATQAERRERTRAAILDAATDRFTEHGFVATSVADILAAAGVSRGALYHHFSSKEDVFAAVYQRVSADAIERAGRASRRADTRLDSLIAGCLAWIDITAEDRVATILLVEGPAALGSERCREIEEEASLGRVKAGLAAAARAGEIDAGDLEMTARVINAALAEAALSIQRNRPQASRAGAHRTITALISGLANGESGRGAS